MLVTAAGPALAQRPGDDDADPTHHKGEKAPATSNALPDPKLVPDPRQRLDPGALLCHTEAQLQQHQAAIAARLAGQPAGEPAGCRILNDMVAVAVMQRHGQARTQVQLHTDPAEVGWTDAMVRDQQQAYGK